MESNEITNLLTIILAVFLCVLVILIIVYVILLAKSKKGNSNKRKSSNEIIINDNKKAKKEKVKIDTTEDISKFMEFEKVQDNMIIQKERSKYIMVVECQGVNYDLMSEAEKIGVEEGFLQFLNTLRHPVQIYVQTRTVNLEESISRYRSKFSQIESEMYKKRQEYMTIKDDLNYTKEQRQKALYAFTKARNLYEYGRDIIEDTEKMSLNKNILNKKYYIIIPYYAEDLKDGNFEIEEIRGHAFTELYTKSQAIIRTLTACGVNGKILNTKELIELLYVAYNRDHEEVFNIDKIIGAGYDKLYSMAEDVYAKKIRAIDKQIEEEAINKAKENLNIAKTALEQEAIRKDKERESIIDELAKMILEENREYVDEKLIDTAIEQIDGEKKSKKTKEKEVNQDGKRKTTRRTTKQ